MKVFLCCLILSGLSLNAQETPEKTTDINQLVPHNDDIKALGRQNAKAELDTEITSAIAAAKYKIKWPAPAELDMSEINRLVEKRATAQLNKQLPPKSISDLKKDALSKYKPYVKGDQVNITLTRALGRNPNIRGKFYGIDSYGQIKIGAHKIPTVDISDIDKVRFFPDLAAPLIEKEAKEALKGYTYERNTLLDDLKASVRKEVNAEAGLIYYNRRWVSTRKLVESMRQNLIKKELQARSKIHSDKLFEFNGFIKNENQWIHPSHTFEPPAFDKQLQAISKNQLEDIMNEKGITINASTLSIHPGAKLYDFDF